MTIRLHSGAAADLGSAGDWYERLLAVGALLGGCSSAARAEPARAAAREGSLRAFLQRWATGKGDSLEESMYTRAWVSLRSDRAMQVVVYIQGKGWCGSGGCTLLVLEPRGETFRVIGHMTITRPPIRILARTTNGWHDIGVHVAGGGIHPGYDAGVPFDGEQYAPNPTFPPARNVTGERVTATVITGHEGEQPLFK